MSMFVMCCLALALYRSASTTSSVWSPLVLFSASPAPDPDQSSSHWQYVSVAGVFSPGSWCLPGCVPSGSQPRAWNGLPASVRTATSLHPFRRQLKTFLYRQSFC